MNRTAKCSAVVSGILLVFSSFQIVSPEIASAAPECTFSQPYPSNPDRICTDYGRSCNSRICAHPPGTPGRWGTDGHYTPKIG